MRLLLMRGRFSATEAVRTPICVLRFAVAVASIGLVLTQLGCATSAGNPPYPAEWASIKSPPTQDGCPNLQGTYSNHGSAIFPVEAGAQPSLADIFTSMARSRAPTGPAAWGQTWPAIPGNASVVSIEQTPETLTVAFIDSSGHRTPLDFRRYRFSLSKKRYDDLFTCRTLYGEPTLTFSVETHFHETWTIVAVVAATSVAMLKSVDGSLVVDLDSASGIEILPMVGSPYRVDNVWYRYPAVALEKRPEQ